MQYILYRTGEYKLKCSDCNKFYIGQSSRLFTTGYKEDIKAINQPYTKTNLSEHLHSIGYKYISIQTKLQFCTRFKKTQNETYYNNLKYINTTKCTKIRF